MRRTGKIFLALLLLGAFTVYGADVKKEEPPKKKETTTTDKKIRATGQINGEPVQLECDFEVTSNLYDAKLSGIKSSMKPNSVSYFVQCNNKDKERAELRFWIVALDKVPADGIIRGLNSNSETNKTPHVTLSFSNKNRSLKEKAQTRENTNLEVKLTTYELNKAAKEALLSGTVSAEWGELGKVEAEFSALVRNIGGL